MRLEFPRSRAARQTIGAAGALILAGGLITAAGQAGAATSGCKIDYSVNQWATGFTANLTITNLGAALTNWKLEWDYAGNQTVTQSWSSTFTQSGTHVALANAAWNGALATNGTVTAGLNANYSGTNTAPTAFKLNGVACTGTATPTPTTTTASPTPSTSPSPTKSPTTPPTSATVAPPTTAPPSGGGAATAIADTGWATQSGGTTGGSTATAAHTYTVSTRAQLIAALAGTDPTTGKTNKKRRQRSSNGSAPST